MDQKKSFVRVFVMMILAIILITLIILVTTLLRNKEKNNEFINIEYNKAIPNIELLTFDSKVIHMSDILTLDKKNFVFCLSEHCIDCVNSLKLFSILIDSNEFLNSYNPIILWTNRIPKSLTESYDLPNYMNYSLNNKYSLSGLLPFFFLCNDSVEFTTYDTNSLINKIKTTPNYTLIQTDIFHNLISQSAKDNLLFLSKDCKACREIELQLDLDDYAVIRDYQEGSIYDPDNLYLNLFGVNTYPAIVSYRNDALVIEYDFEPYVNLP